ncbi:MAG: amino acid racemase [Ekhidna sp.]|nr:amino acid racemase [Ekhidna sp.]
MKKFGLIGGIGPESTAKYYQLIIKEYRKRLQTEAYPEFIIKSINMTEMLEFIFRKDFDGLVDFLNTYLTEFHRLGIDFSALASNTPHIVFDQLNELSKLPLTSIVEETCSVIQSNQLKCVGLLGTKSTKEAGFYQAKSEQHGFDIITPEEEQREYINRKYFEELVFNQIEPTTKSNLIEIVHDLRKKNEIQGLVLGGTELSLILDQSDFEEIKVFYTTKIHVEAIVSQMIQD